MAQEDWWKAAGTPASKDDWWSGAGTPEAAPTQATPAPAAIERPSGLIRRVVGDTAVDLGKGVVGFGEAAVGLGNLVSGGYVGKGLEAIGYDPQTTKKMLEEGYTNERVAANKAVSDAKGFVGTAKALIQNPSSLIGSAVESAPLMLGGGAVARGGAALLGRAGSIAAPGIGGQLAAIPATTAGRIGLAAAGEGLVGAGSAAEGIRQQSDDGLLSAKQTGAALASGAGTAALAALGGKVAQKLGIADIDVALAGGAKAAGEAPKNILRRTIEGMVSEGLLEELPQSMQEQMWQNVATDKPLMEGVPEAAAAGALAGGLMGGGFSALSKPDVRPQPAPNAADKSAGTAGQVPAADTSEPLSGVAAPLSGDIPIQPQTPAAQMAANMRMEAQVQRANAKTVLGRAAADATDMQADAVQASDPFNLSGMGATENTDGFTRLGAIAQSLNLDPEVIVAAARADVGDDPKYSLDGLDDRILASYAQSLAPTVQPAQAQDGFPSEGAGSAQPTPVQAPSVEAQSGQANPVEGGGLAVKSPVAAGDEPAPASVSAAGAQAQRVIDSRPWQAFRGGRRVESYSTENIRADAKNSIDNGYGVYVTSDTATADHYGSKLEGGSRHTLEISAPRHSLLDRDKPLSEQSPQIIAGLKAAGLYEGNESTLGSGLYDRLVSENKKGGLSLARGSSVDAMKAANARLQAAGIRGLSYQARHIPGVTNTAEHYVIFDGADIRNTDQTNAGAQAKEVSTASNAYPQEGAETRAATAPEPTNYDESENILDSDITTPSGTPFTIRDAADRAAARHEGGRVFPVDGGFVVRVPSPQASSQGRTEAPQPVPASQEQGATAGQAQVAPAQGGATAPEVQGQAPQPASAAGAAQSVLGQSVPSPQATPAPDSPQARQAAREANVPADLIAKRDAAAERLKAASAAMTAFPSGNMGLTPNAVKATPEWRAAKIEMDRATVAARNANAAVVKAAKGQASVSPPSAAPASASVGAATEGGQGSVKAAQEGSVSEPMGFMAAEREAKRLTAETGTKHKAVSRDWTDADGMSTGGWFVEPEGAANAAPQGRPDPGRYVQPVGNGSAEQQKDLANRGSTIAAIKALNSMAAKVDPNAVYTDAEIEKAANFDGMRDYLSNIAVKASKPETKPTPKKPRSQMTSKELRAAEAEKAKKAPRKHHVAIYNGKEVTIDYAGDNPKQEFKVAAQRISDNLPLGQKGIVVAPDGKRYEVTSGKGTAKLLPATAPATQSGQDRAQDGQVDEAAVREEYRTAMRGKTGVATHDWGSNSFADMIVNALKRDPAAIEQARKDLTNGSNQTGLRVFAKFAGITLPRSQRDQKAAIDAWAGITPEQRASSEKVKADTKASQSADKAMKSARSGAASVAMHSPDGKSVDGAAWVDGLIAEGYTIIVQRGAATYLAKPDGSGYKMPHKAIAAYARLAAKSAAEAKPEATKAEQPALHQDPGEPAEQVTPAVIADAAKTADRAPTVSMAEARKTLLAQIDAAIKAAPNEGVLDNPPTAKKMRNGRKTWDVDIGRQVQGLAVPAMTIVESHDGLTYTIGKVNTDKVLTKEGSLLSARLTAARLQQGAEWAAGGKTGGWTFTPTPVADKLTLDVPGDGSFKVRNTKERLIEFRKQVESFFKLPKQETPKPESLTVSQATRDKIMAEAETVDEPATTSKEQAKSNKEPAKSASAAPVDAAQAGKADDRAVALASYFKPGNIIKSYAGYDEVLSYRPADGNRSMQVDVHEVRNVNGEWVRVGKPQDARWHSTLPDARELKAGPIDTVPAGDATYTEPRADGRAFPNAPRRSAQVATATHAAPVEAAQPDKKESKPTAQVASEPVLESVDGIDPLTNAAKKFFGTTRDPKEAGYILPSGDMLDFSGRHYSDNHPSLHGQRSVDHRELLGENSKGDSLDELFNLPNGSGSEYMQEFMGRTGAMRVDFNAGVASIMGEPSPEQIRALSQNLRGDYAALSVIDHKSGRIIDETEIDSPTPMSVRRFFDKARGKVAADNAPLFDQSSQYGERQDTAPNIDSTAEMRVIAREFSQADGMAGADRLGLRKAVNAALGGYPPVNVTYLRGEEGLDGIAKPGYVKRLQDQRASRDSKARTAGLYLRASETVDGKPRVVLFTDVANTPTKAMFTAAHEIAGHHGLRSLLGMKLNTTLARAYQNPTVKAVADAIYTSRSIDANVAKGRITAKEGRLLAIEEALADLAAANRLGRYEEIQSRHGVTVPLTQQKGLKATIARAIEAIKAIFRAKNVRFTDAQVHSLLEASWKAAQDKSASFTSLNANGTLEQVVFHGTPHTVDKFSLNKIGTGEGAQAFGWGMYFASMREIAEQYQRTLSYGRYGEGQYKRSDGEVLGPDDVDADINDLIGFEFPDDDAARRDGAFYRGATAAKSSMMAGLSEREAMNKATSKYERFAVEQLYGDYQFEAPQKGNLYRVEIPEDSDLLDWDKPLSEQPEKVRAALQQAASPKGLGQIGARDADRFANVVQGASFRAKGYRGLDVPSQRIVLKGMREVVNNLKVFDAVVPLIPVDMVNVLRGKEFASEKMLHDPSVFLNLLSAEGRGGVALSVDAANSAIRRIADAASAEMPGVRDESVRVPKDFLAALSAGDFDQLAGSKIYGALSNELGSAENASNYLMSIGVSGTRYLDGNSRNPFPFDVQVFDKSGTLLKFEKVRSRAAADAMVADAEASGHTAKVIGRPVEAGSANYVIWDESAIGQPQSALESVSDDTRDTYNARIDALFKGDKAALKGVRILDRSDVLGMMGLGEGPMNIAEGKVIEGRYNHKLTAADWKKVPGWLENPALVFQSEQGDGSRLVFIAPETVGGEIVRMIVQPNAKNGADVHLLVNAYDAAGGNPLLRWAQDDLLRYVDTKKSPALAARSGRRLPGFADKPRGSAQTILTQKDLGKYREEAGQAAVIGTPSSALESTEDQTQSEAFKKWFGSSVVTEDGKAGGKPLVVYHGTNADFIEFASGDGMLGRGIYFTPKAEAAPLYPKMQNMRAVREGRDPGPVSVVPVFVSLKNPLTFTELPVGKVDAAKVAAQGFDGIVLLNPDGSIKELTAFRPEQIKSATGNNGNFNPDNPSILESVEDDLFEVSTPETITAADLKIPGQIAVKREGVKGWLNAAGKKLKDRKPAALALVPLNHLADFASKGMGAVQQYIDQHYAMQAYRNGLYRDYDAIAQDWLKYASGTGIKGFLGKAATQAGRDLSDLMHDSTIAGIDPSVENASYKEADKQRIYNELRARYTAMPEQGQALFNRVRDAYKRQSTMLEEVIEANLKRAMEINKAKAERDYEDRIREIEESGASDDEKARLKANAANLHDDRVKEADQRTNAKTMALRATFESMRVEAPYFPLKRYGKYWVTVLKNGTMQGFSKFQTAEEQDAFVKQMKAQGFDVRTKYEGGDTKTHEMIDPAFIAEIEGILEGAQMPDSVKDDIWQAYLERMPEMSLRKSFIHRQKVQGYHPDALKAFSSTSFHGSYQLARLKYGMEMAETLDIAEKQAARVAPVQGEQLVGELRKRHAFIMNPTGGALAQGLTTAAFVYYLGANPAHLLLNATQTVMLGIPILGARYGFGRTTNALQKAMRDFASGKGHLENANLTADERKAFQTFIDSGLIDKTQAHDLAGVGETGVEYNAVRQKVMNKIGWFFHQSERFNREVTAMAAYRLARQDGRSHDTAVAQAMRATYEIHFDYSAAARARVMQGDVAKSLLVFRNYQVNVLYRLFRDIHQSLRGESVQVRREARKQLGAMMGMYGLFAGVAGMPFYGLAMALAGAFEDDDDPETAEQQFVRGTVELIGPDVARVLLKGVPGAAFNIDLTDRIGMPNLWFRSPDRELEGRDAYYYWMEQVLGAGVGVIKQGYDGASLIFDGLQDANSGHVARGLEKMLPAAARNVFKSVRYGADGVTTLNGEKILDLGAGGLVAQGLGYTPLDLAERYDANRELKNANAKLERRRRALLDRLFLASQHGDPTDRAMLDIQAFNAKNPDYAITRQTIGRSAKLRNRNRLLNENGIVMTRRMRRLQDRMREGQAEE